MKLPLQIPSYFFTKQVVIGGSVSTGIRRSVFRSALPLMCFFSAAIGSALGVSGCEQSSSAPRQGVTNGAAESISDAPTTVVQAGRPAAGLEAPDFELRDLSGQLVSLRSLRGKAVLLNFWATWCAPCVAEMPSLVRLSGELKGKGVEILSINVDGAKKKDQVIRFAQENGMTFPVLLDPTFSVPPLFSVNGFPETLLIDANGRLREVRDPIEDRKVVKFLGDRPWDAPPFREAILEALRP